MEQSNKVSININDPLVSVLIPLYNAEKFIIQTLDCCTNQIYKNLEVIVVDDGSIDNSYTLALEYSNNHPQVKVFKQKHSGASRARNFALNQSKGDYIMYLDADDLMTENKIFNQIELMKRLNDPYAVVICAYEEFKDELPLFWTKRLHYHDYSISIDLLVDIWSKGAMVPVTCYLVTREMLMTVGDWDERLSLNDDGDYFSRVLMCATSVSFTSECCFFYRRGHSSLSTSAKYSEYKLRSLLLSYQKQKKILNIENSPRVKSALARNFSLVLNSTKYGSILYKEALLEIKNLGQKPQIINPSILVRIFSKLFGVEFYLFFKSCVKCVIK